MDNLLHLALERGYGESLMHGLHPYAVVFLNVVPDTIDVNIHPQKLQVKFSEPQVVYNELARAVRETLRQFTGYQLYVDKRESALFASEPPVENSDGKTIRNVQSDWQDGKRASDWRNERTGSFSTNATGQPRIEMRTPIILLIVPMILREIYNSMERLDRRYHFAANR